MITFRGPGRSLTLIIVDMKDHRRSHEQKIPCHPLIQSPPTTMRTPVSTLLSLLSPTHCASTPAPFQLRSNADPDLWFWPCPDAPPPPPYVGGDNQMPILFFTLWYTSYCLQCRGNQIYRHFPPGGPLPPFCTPCQSPINISLCHSNVSLEKILVPVNSKRTVWCLEGHKRSIWALVFMR